MVFFDLDGTLIDSNGVWLQIDVDFLARRGLAPTDRYSYVVSRSIFPAAARFTVDYYHLDETPEAIMAEWEEMARHAYAHTIPLKPGAAAVLERLRVQGTRTALLTAGLPALAQAALDHHGLRTYFEDLFFAQEAGLEKRDAAIYRLASDRFGVPCSQCVLVEDAPENCFAARQAGFRVVGVYDSFYRERWEELKAASHKAVRSLEELL